MITFNNGHSASNIQIHQRRIVEPKHNSRNYQHNVSLSKFYALGLHGVTAKVAVTNPVHGLPLTHHQRSLAHHMDSCTTLTVALHLRLQFPPSIALTTHTADCTDHTLYISLGLPLCHCRVLFSILQMLATYQAFPCLFFCSVSCIVLHFSLSEC